MASYSASYLAACVAAIKKPENSGYERLTCGQALERNTGSKNKKTEERTRGPRDGSLQTLPYSPFKSYKFQVLK